MDQVSVGIIGFGLAGSVFHAPLIRAVPALSLKCVSTSRTAQAEASGLAVADSPDALIADPGINLVVIASPNRTHHPLAMAALEAGKHVVIDKPMALSTGEADEMIARARRRRRVLTAFHNRRWDGDFLTVRELVDRGSLGEILLFEAHWDRFRPAIKQGWRETAEPGAGLLADLGPHMIDQALLLFGAPEAVTADIAVQRAGATADDYFDLTLLYRSRRVRLAASTLAAAPRPRFALHGTRGSFVKGGLDVQEPQLKAGMVPAEPGFGVEPSRQHGVLTEGDGRATPVETRAGRYPGFYETVAAAILDDAPVPVAPEDARAGLAIIEAARQSAREGRRIPL